MISFLIKKMFKIPAFNYFKSCMCQCYLQSPYYLTQEQNSLLLANFKFLHHGMSHTPQNMNHMVTVFLHVFNYLNRFELIVLFSDVNKIFDGTRNWCMEKVLWELFDNLSLSNFWLSIQYCHYQTERRISPCMKLYKFSWAKEQ